MARQTVKDDSIYFAQAKTQCREETRGDLPALQGDQGPESVRTGKKFLYYSEHREEPGIRDGCDRKKGTRKKNTAKSNEPELSRNRTCRHSEREGQPRKGKRWGQPLRSAVRKSKQCENSSRIQHPPQAERNPAEGLRSNFGELTSLEGSEGLGGVEYHGIPRAGTKGEEEAVRHILPA